MARGRLLSKRGSEPLPKDDFLYQGVFAHLVQPLAEWIDLFRRSDLSTGGGSRRNRSAARLRLYLIAHGRLSQLLKKIGLRRGRARSAALYALAIEVPAAILARMLGVHIQVAVRRQQAAVPSNWANYAANVSRCNRPENT